MDTRYTDFHNHLDAAFREELLEHLIRWIPALLLEEPPKWPSLRKAIARACETYGVPSIHYQVLLNEMARSQ